MTIEDCVESLNRLRESNGMNGYYVVHRVKDVHPQFKAYKTITYTLWFITNDNKSVVLTSQISDRITDSNIESVEKELCITFLVEILKLVQNGI